MEKKLYIAKTLMGLEEVLAEELTQYGAVEIKPGRRMVEFIADEKTMYAINYRAFLCLRLLESFHTFRFTGIEKYYDNIISLPWDNVIEPGQTIAIDASVFNSKIFNNSHFAEQKTKDAVVDYFRNKYGKRPSVNIDNPALLINIFIQSDFCHVSLDTSGIPLYKRGYREVLHEASINEVLAAGLIRLSGWSGTGDFYAPMCGGATIAVEASMFASGMPAGFFRQQWGFMNWKSYKPKLWQQVKEEHPPLDRKNFSVYASDISSQSIHKARKNIARAGMVKIISLHQSAFVNLIPKNESGIMIFNPPYAVRTNVKDIIGFYQDIGNHLKHNFKGHTAWIISSNIEAIKHIGLKPSKKYNLMNGQLEAKYYGFIIHS